MSLYLVPGTYGNASFAGMMRNPHGHSALAKALVKSLGPRAHRVYY
jgi:hypothetical protein